MRKITNFYFGEKVRKSSTKDFAQVMRRGSEVRTARAAGTQDSAAASRPPMSIPSTGGHRCRRRMVPPMALLQFPGTKP